MIITKWSTFDNDLFCFTVKSLRSSILDEHFPIKIAIVNECDYFNPNNKSDFHIERVKPVENVIYLVQNGLNHSSDTTSRNNMQQTGEQK